MKIYTSYFGNMRNIKDANLTPISIALKKPDFYFGASIKQLAPAPDMLKLDPYAYRKRFSLILRSINPHALLKHIEKLSAGKDAVLLCYEKEGFCHRHLVAQWLKEKTGFEVEEFINIPKKQTSDTQGKLF